MPFFKVCYLFGVILPKDRDPRFVTIRRGGTLTNSDHYLLALWAAGCAEHVLYLFELAQPDDPRPRQAIEHARAWVGGEVSMTQARAAGGHAMGAARDLRGAARYAAYAAGQAACVAHVAAHELGAAAYAIKAARAAALEGTGEVKAARAAALEGTGEVKAACAAALEGTGEVKAAGAAALEGTGEVKAAGAGARKVQADEAGRLECQWQRNQLPDAIRELVLDDERLRNAICWSVFGC